MADYYPLLSRAAEALEHNTPEQRRQVYERARVALVRQLRGITPPLSEPEITRERLALEDAIRRVEAEARGKEAPAPAQPYLPRTADTPVYAQRPQVTSAAPSQHYAAPSAAQIPTEALEPPPEPTIHQELQSRQSVGVSPSPSSRGGNTQKRSRPVRKYNARHIPMRVRFAPLAAISVIALLVAGGYGIYTLRDDIGGWFNSKEIELSNEQQPVIKNEGRVTSEGENAVQNTGQSVISSNPTSAIIEPPPLGENPAVSQRAMLYEETPNNENGVASPANVVWRTEQIPASVAGQPAETQLRADIAIADRKMQVILLIKRNTDATLPASHTLEIQFVLPPDFNNEGIASVPGLLFKESEDARGTVLDGLSVRVTKDFFLIGLSNAPDKQAANLDLLANRSWMDLPIQYDNGRRAVLTIEKGIPGEKAFQEAITAWKEAAARSTVQ